MIPIAVYLIDMKQYTCAEVAQLTGKAERTVRKAAETKGDIGRKFGAVWMFTDADIAKIKAIRMGAPRKPRKAKPATQPTTEPTP